MASLYQIVQDRVGHSFGSEVIVQNIEKAIADASGGIAKPQASFFNPMDMFMGKEWLMKTSPTSVDLTFNDLRNMAKNPIIGSIIQTRLNQAAAFMRPQETSFDLGFKILSTVRDAEDSDKAHEISMFIESAGLEDYGEDSLEDLARKYLRDSLELDHAAAEIVPRKNGEPAYIVAIDSEQIRKTRESLNFHQPAGTRPYYVQILENKVIAEFTQAQLMLGIRNPRTNMGAHGYGFSELEMLIRTVSTILNTEAYISSQVAGGGTHKGILTVKGANIDPTEFQAFKNEFAEALRNASRHWTPPVLRVGDQGEVEWLRIDQTGRDMEYAKLFDFLVKEACGVYQISPEEINWSIGASGASTQFQSSGVDRERILFSQKRGLKPLLTFFASSLNKSFIKPIDPNFRIEFVGLGEDRKDDVDIRVKEVTNFKTVNEARLDIGLPKIDGGDMILNPEFRRQETEEEFDLSPEFGSKSFRE